MPKMKFYNTATSQWEALDAKDADTLDGKHLSEIQSETNTELDKKVDKVSGKVLSTNDYTTAEKTKLSGIATGATNTVLNNTVTSTSTTQAATANAVKLANDNANTRLSRAGGTMIGILEAQSNTSYTVRQVRNMILSPSDAVLSSMQNGDIWIKYK